MGAVNFRGRPPMFKAPTKGQKRPQKEKGPRSILSFRGRFSANGCLKFRLSWDLRPDDSRNFKRPFAEKHPRKDKMLPGGRKFNKKFICDTVATAKKFPPKVKEEAVLPWIYIR